MALDKIELSKHQNATKQNDTNQTFRKMPISKWYKANNKQNVTKQNDNKQTFCKMSLNKMKQGKH